MTESIKMLTIDDKSLTTNLDRAGYRKMGVIVRSAAYYQEALDCIADKPVDVVVINMDFGEIDGIAIASHLKKQYPDLAVVLTSVQGSASNRKKALATGADLFVEQPIPRDYFIEKIKSLLEQQARTTERVAIHGEVKFNWNNELLSQPIGDLSISGMLIASDLELPDGSVIEFEFSLPGQKKSLKVTGQVVRKIRVNENHPDRLAGIGVRFETFHGDAEKRLQNYVDKSADKQARMTYYL